MAIRQETVPASQTTKMTWMSLRLATSLGLCATTYDVVLQSESKVLTAEDVGKALDMLGRTANGADFAFIRCQVTAR